MRARRWAPAVLACLLLGGCSLTSPGTLESLGNRHAGAGSIRWYDSPDDLLGNTRYMVGDADAKPLTTAVVAGRFESAGPGMAFTVPGGDAPGGQAADFDDPDAVWRTVEGSFVVDQVLSGDASAGDRLVVGLAFDPDIDPETVGRDLRELGRTRLFLDRSPVFAHNPQAYGTAADGTLLVSIADDGALALPVLDAAQTGELLRATPTLAALTAAAARPPRTLVMDPTGSEVVEERTDP